MSAIELRGVRTHNLKNLDIDLPRDSLIVITGVSGSGKSSLAFDTLYAEGQRRYVESLSAYARQFLSLMEKPDLDTIEGLSPAIAIEQKATSHNPRSTVGTITEIYDYLRLLFARVGEPHCPTHHHVLRAQTISQMVDQMLALPDESSVMIVAPLVKQRKGEHVDLFDRLRMQGFLRVRINGRLYELDALPTIDAKKKNTIEVVVDRLKVRPTHQQRMAESLESAVELGDGVAMVCSMSDDAVPILTFSARYACAECGFSLTELEPRIFSFNNPAGACYSCDGLGVEQTFDPEKVIHDRSISIAQGAIRGWDRRARYYFQWLCALAQHFGFDIDQSFETLPQQYQEIILYGSNESIAFEYVDHHGRQITRRHTFEGVIPNLKRRYQETQSSAVREELSKYLSTKPCASCQGARLQPAACAVYIADKNLPEMTALSIGQTLAFFQSLRLKGQRAQIAEKIVNEIVARLGFLVDVGLEYLTLARRSNTLSGGEAQRIRLASQIGSGLVGVLYILDEPSIGLHQRDNARLLATLLQLRDLGNTVVVVEHDEDAIRAADYIIDIGPGAGIHGGQIVASGSQKEIMAVPHSLTGQYLTGEKAIAVPSKRLASACRQWLVITGATCNNLQSVTLKLPLGMMVCITGVSGSGKSSLINDTLYPLVVQKLHRAAVDRIAPYDTIDGLEHLDKVIAIDQSPIGRTPRSNPATYTGLFTPIRELFAGTEMARSRGYKPGRFSFNVSGGRCAACEGDGVTKVEMHFLADIYVACDVCQGKRYNRETLEVRYKGQSIDDVLNMTVEQAVDFFAAIPVIQRKLVTLMDVGLSYLTLGQSAITLSGGEAQRIKLSRELSKRGTGKTLYILDEPTTGLHFHDVAQLVDVLNCLRDAGNTVVIIEHNLDVIKVADWIIDMGPEGGSRGGHIIAEGAPERVAKVKGSHTGFYLNKIFKEAQKNVAK